MLLRFPDIAARDAFRADINADRKLPPGKHGTRSWVQPDDGYLVRVYEPMSKALAQKYAANVVDDGADGTREKAAIQTVLDATVDKRAAMSARVNFNAVMR